jgi:hypothetical protein
VPIRIDDATASCEVTAAGISNAPKKLHEELARGRRGQVIDGVKGLWRLAVTEEGKGAAMVVCVDRGEGGNTASKYGRKPSRFRPLFEEVFCRISMPWEMRTSQNEIRHEIRHQKILDRTSLENDGVAGEEMAGRFLPDFGIALDEIL